MTWKLTGLAVLACLSAAGCGARHVELTADPPTVLWCPASGEAHLSLEFGSNEPVDGEEVKPWEGSYTFSFHARGGGAAGGRNSSHPRRVVPARGERWRLTQTAQLPDRPQELSYQIGKAEGLGSLWARRYRVEPLTAASGDPCEELPLSRLPDEDGEVDAEAGSP